MIYIVSVFGKELDQIYTPNLNRHLGNWKMKIFLTRLNLMIQTTSMITRYHWWTKNLFILCWIQYSIIKVQ